MPNLKSEFEAALKRFEGLKYPDGKVPDASDVVRAFDQEVGIENWRRIMLEKLKS